MRKHTKTSRGFTLIEMLLVVAILGVMALIGVQYLNQQVQEKRIARAVQQVQQWFVAARSYSDAYLQGWPSDDQIKTYLCHSKSFCPNDSVTDLKSPWGKTYHIVSAADAKLFALRTWLPSKELAQKLAARIPGSNYDKKVVTFHMPTTVYTSQNQSELMVKGVYTLQITHLNMNVRSYKPQCPLNMIANYQVALAGFTAPKMTKDSSVIAGLYNYDASMMKLAKVECTPDWRVFLYAKKNQHLSDNLKSTGKGEFVLITWCQPTTSRSIVPMPLCRH